MGKNLVEHRRNTEKMRHIPLLDMAHRIKYLPRIPGTVSEDAVNFYVIDREKKTLSIVRVGASVNDLMETRRVLVIPYEKKGE